MKFIFKVCSILVVFTICFQSSNKQVTAKSTVDILNYNIAVSSKTIELSLKETIELTYPAAKRWNKEAMLLHCNSVDGDKDIRGLDGKRRYWIINFGVPNTNKQIIVLVSNGKIQLLHDITRNGLIRTKQDFIELSDIIFDSPQLLLMATTLTELYPGNKWAKGYNFEITRFKDSTSNIVGIVIYGWEKNIKKMKVVPFNATTGEYIPMQVGFISS